MEYIIGAILWLYVLYWIFLIVSKLFSLSVDAARTLLRSIPALIWSWRKPFFFLNWLLWAYQYPGRWVPWLRDYNKGVSRPVFFLFLPLRLLYWGYLYIYMTPVRFITAVYFDFLVFLSFSVTIALMDLFYPESKTYRQSYGWRRTFKVAAFFPARLVIFLLQNVRIIVQSLCMVALDTVFTTVTGFHGTDAANVGRPDPDKENPTIFQKGMWYVGTGDYAGRGIYFGLQENVADHYARGSNYPLIVMARVTLFLMRPIPTLPKDYRHVGEYGNGLKISDEFKYAWLWRTTELFRADRGGWYELCVLMPKKSGQLVKSWRIRPLLVLDEDRRWCRIWGGAALFPSTGPELAAVGYACLIWLLASYYQPQGGFSLPRPRQVQTAVSSQNPIDQLHAYAKACSSGDSSGAYQMFSQEAKREKKYLASETAYYDKLFKNQAGMNLSDFSAPSYESGNTVVRVNFRADVTKADRSGVEPYRIQATLVLENGEWKIDEWKAQ